MSEPFVTYAQNFEDVMLWRALGHVKDGCYIDIGAQDPVIDSVSRAFYERGWRGISVEPVPEYARQLRDDRPDEQIIEAAVGAEVGETEIAVFPGTGLSTVVDEVAERHRASLADVQYRQVRVAVTTLAEIARQVEGREVHWLKVDVEGFERAVLEGWPADKLRPWVIVVEATSPNGREQTHGEWEHIVLAAGYHCVFFDGLNRFYLSPEHPELAQAFAAPANTFDNVRLRPHSSLCIDVVAQYQRHVDSQQVTIDGLGAQISHLDEQMHALSLRYDALARARAQLQQTTEQLQQSNHALQQQVTVGQQMLLDMQSSLSWRLTGPLRRAVDLYGFLLNYLPVGLRTRVLTQVQRWRGTPLNGGAQLPREYPATVLGVGAPLSAGASEWLERLQSAAERKD